jgi:hypothetical protein
LGTTQQQTGRKRRVLQFRDWCQANDGSCVFFADPHKFNSHYIDDRKPDSDNSFFSSQRLPDGLWGSSSLLFNGHQGLPPPPSGNGT